MYKEFNLFVNQFDLSNDEIFEKVEHSIRVSNKMMKYATRLGYSKEEITLCEEVGLYHDLKCFKEDVEINLDNFNIDEKNKKAVMFAIDNHKALVLPKNEDANVLKIAKLLRDVDKIDNLYTRSVSTKFTKKEDNSKVSDNVLDCIRNHKSVDTSLVKTNNDALLVPFGFTFDLNNHMCLDEYYENFKSYYKNISNTGKLKDLYDDVCNYIEEKMK